MLKFRSSIFSLTLLLAVGAVDPLPAQNNINVPANGSVLLNGSGSYQNVSVGTGGTLTTIDSNSGGAGDRAITITLAAGETGTIQNDGMIDLEGNDQGNTTVFAHDVTLSGSGTLELLNAYGYNDASVQGPGTVTQAAGHTLIGGEGQTDDPGPSFGAPLVNHGLVTTSDVGMVLDGASLVNTSTFSATNGATLRLEAPTLDNTGGTVLAAAKSYVYLDGVTVTGGTLSSVNDTGSDFDNGGYFNNESPDTLNNVTFSTGSAFYVSNPITIEGTLTNNGYFFLAGPNYNTKLTGGFAVAANATLAGTGTTQMQGGEIDATNNATLTVAAGASIYGGPGTINASLINNGTVEDFYQALTINSPTFTNKGLLAAANGSMLYLKGPVLNNTGGTITAEASSYVYLDGVTVTGGTLSSVNDTGSDFDNGGYFNNESPDTLNNVTFSTGSAFYVSNPITIEGTLTNNGYFFLAGPNYNTGLTGGFAVAANARLAGTGTARLVNGEIDATNNATLTVAAGANLFGGPGTINASLVNNGTVESIYQTLTINSPTFTNNGLLSAAGDSGADTNATITVSGATNLTNFNAGSGTLTGGTYAVADVGDGATLDFGGRNVLVNAATVTLSGANANFNAINGLTSNTGTLALLNLIQFSNSGALSNTGTITLDAGSTFHVGGAYTATGSKAVLAVVIGGTASQGAASPGILQVNGTATLAGTLSLSFPTGATLPASTAALTIVSAASPLGGSFTNVANGARLTTTDGKGSFLVNYGAGSANPAAVVLSEFVPTGGPVITSAATASGKVGAVFSYQITATNSPTSFGVQGLPGGLTVNASTGVVSGMPKAAGTYILTLNAYNGKGKGSATLTLNVAAGPPVVTGGTASATAGNTFSYQITATNNPTNYGVQGLPGGLTVNSSTGLITGKPNAANTYTLTLNAYNAGGKGSATLTLTVAPAGPPVITSATSASGMVGAAFSYQITATNSPTSFGVQGLPGGLTVNATTGAITGTPKAAGKYTLTLNAYNGVGKGSAVLTLTVTQ